MNPVKYRQLTVIADIASHYQEYYIDVADYYEEKYLQSVHLETLRRDWNGT